MLLNYHVGRFVLGSLCAGDLVRLGLSSVRVAGWRTASACNTDTTQIANTQRTENKTTDVVIQQHSRKLLMMDILISETCWVHKKWNKIASNIKLVFYSSTITMTHGPINTMISCSVVPMNTSKHFSSPPSMPRKPPFWSSLICLWQEVQTVKLLIQFSSSCYFLPLRPRLCSAVPFFGTALTQVLPCMGQTYCSVYFNIHV